MVDQRNGGIAWTEETWNPLLRWQRPRRVFVNSMSDLFHEAVPDAFIERVLITTAHAHQHTFQILTKRPDRMRDVMQRWSDMNGRPQRNLWLGVSVEDQASADERIPLLLKTPAAVRWISAEPLLGPIDLRFTNGLVHGCDAADYLLDWVVVGGESGPNARPLHPDWVRALRDQCASAGVPFLFKQWGEFIASRELHNANVIAGHQLHSFPWGLCNPQMARVGTKVAGRLLDGVLHDGYPVIQP